MAKRRQTTGVPKKRKRALASAEADPGGQSLKREHLSHAEREAEIQRMVLWGTGAVLAVIVAVIVIAFIRDRIINPNRTVATVNGEKITVSEFQDRVRFERLLLIERINTKLDEFMAWGFTSDINEAFEQLYQFDPEFKTAWEELGLRDQMGLRVINDMIADQLVREEAERLNITVTQEDIDEQLYPLFGFNTSAGLEQEVAVEVEGTPETTPEPLTPTPTPFVSPTPTPEPTATPPPEVEPTIINTPFPTLEPAPTMSFEEHYDIFERNREAFYDRAAREANMSRAEVNAYFETRALRVALSKVVIEPDTTSTWVNARHILVTTEDEALDIIAALNAGESFADLARAASQDTGSAPRGGELGWQDTNNYVPEFAEAIRALPIGEISPPVQTDYGFHIIQVRAREERDLSESLIEYNRQQDFEEWLDTLRNREGVEYEISDIWLDHVPTKPDFLLRGYY